MIGARNANPRAGYTLAEVLIASVLVATLLATCWSLMSLYSSFLSAGRGAVVERQLARSLTDLLTDDIRRIPLPARASGNHPFPRSAPSFAEEQSAGFTLAAPGPPPPAIPPIASDPTLLVDPTVELSGSSTTLRLTFIPPEDDQSEPAAAAAVELTDDLSGELTTATAFAHEPRMVYYHFEEPRPTTEGDFALSFGLHRIEASALDLHEALRAASASEELTGAPAASLNQLAVDTLFQPADPLSELDETVGSRQFEPDHEHVPEVVRCEFEFHDGRNWIPRWNSRHRRCLPTAIRVTLWLVSPDELELIRPYLEPDSALTAEGDSLPGVRPRRFQRVISLTAADNILEAALPREAGL